MIMLRGLCAFIVALSVPCAAFCSEFEIRLPEGWTEVTGTPEGFDAGFRKPLADGAEATLLLHYMPAPMDESNAPLAPDLHEHWNALVRSMFPDAEELTTPPVDVGGTVLVNSMYVLTDLGVRLQRRFTYFVAGGTAFVVWCSSPPDDWQVVLPDFDAMLATLAPGQEGQTTVVADSAAVSDLTRDLPRLAATFPPQWPCEIGDVTIDRGSSGEAGGVVEIAVAFRRADLAAIYRAMKVAFRMMAEGTFDGQSIEELPPEVRAVDSEAAADFMLYVGQVMGCAFVYVAPCEPPVSLIRVVLLDGSGARLGSIAVSRADMARVLTGGVSESDPSAAATMYLFE